MTKDDRDWFEVERFLESRSRRKTLEYRVRWEGYNAKYDTWEPATALRRDLGAHTFKELVAELIKKRRTAMVSFFLSQSKGKREVKTATP